MADYYTQSCTLIRCPPGTEEMAAAWVREMEAFSTEARFMKSILEGDHNDEWDESWLEENTHGAAFLKRQQKDLSAFLDYVGSLVVEIQLAKDEDNTTCVLFMDDGGEIGIDYTAFLVQDLLILLDSNENVFVEWANTCSKHRPGGFSGGSCLVRKEGITFIDVEQALVERHAQDFKDSAGHG